MSITFATLQSLGPVRSPRLSSATALAAGVDPAEVAKRIETVMRVYTHRFADTNRNTASKVEALYGAPVEKL